MDIEKIINNVRVMRSITSLEPREFEQLVFAFEKEWMKQNTRKTFEGEVRQWEAGAGRKGVLVQSREKVFFILMYYKLYPIQEAMAFFWGMSQGRVCDWIHRLTPVIQAVLGKELKLPERQPKKLHAILRECPELKFIIDGTERRVRRPQDKDQQKKNYSGKRKAHTKKNVLITSGKRVVYLSQTQPGRCHDKKVAQEIEGRRFPSPEAFCCRIVASLDLNLKAPMSGCLRRNPKENRWLRGGKRSTDPYPRFESVWST